MNQFDFKKTFGSDNHSGVHPAVLQSLAEYNVSHSHSYGSDELTKHTTNLFKEIVHPKAQPTFVFNGTAANVLSIKVLTESYHSVLCTDISHMQLDECGAPEKATGTKLISVKSKLGKIDLEDAERHCIRFGDQHYSQPKVISITQPTEVGTCYSVEELGEIREFCDKYNLKLHIDGARFGYAPIFLKTSFQNIIDSCSPDAISFGGTKNGLLFGESVLFFNQDTERVKFFRKQLMQLPSKMRFLSAQFKVFFEQELFRSIPEKCHELAKYFESSLNGINAIELQYPVEANSLFPKLSKDLSKQLKKDKFFYVWDEHEWVMRWMMSYDTEKSEIDEFVSKIKSLT